MINRCLQQYFLRPLPMSKIIMHDYWAALIAKVFGKIGFVNEPTMYYRQHGNNSVGAKDAKNPVFLYHRLKEGKNSYRRMMIESMEQMQGFVETYGEEIDNLDVYELLESYGELYYKGKIKRLSFYKNHHVLKEGNIRKLMQWCFGDRNIYEKSIRTCRKICDHVSVVFISKKQKDIYLWSMAWRTVCRQSQISVFRSTRA